MDTIKCDDIINLTLERANKTIGDIFSSDVICLTTPMRQPIDDAIKDEIEEIKIRNSNNKKLTVILQTTGGSIETVERIVSVFRKHYSTVDFIVPNYAYSAGTVLVLSGDEIYMDYYSVLGPIDPQIQMDSRFVPGMGYLAKFEEMVEKINSVGPENTRAELAYLIKKFDPAVLFLIEQSIEHSKSLIREWLPKYKFKNWKKRATTGDPVKPKDRRERANNIATILGDAKRWHSHGRGIGIKELESEEIKLKIVNYGDDDDLNHNISHYHGLFSDYIAKMGFSAAIHSSRGLRRL